MDRSGNGGSMTAMQGSRAFRYLPLVAFLVVYVLSCVVGALLFIAGDRQFVALFEYFSGTRPPSLSAAEQTTDLLLLFAAPAALVAGYAAVQLLPRLRATQRNDAATAEPRRGPTWLPHVVFWILAAAAIVSLAHGGALGRAHSWFNYSSWIHARSTNFQNLDFAEFVNLYVLVPTAAAWVVVATCGGGVGAQFARWLPPVVAVAFSLLLYMRKAAIAVILLVAFAWIIDLSRRGLRGVRWLAAGTVLAVAALYFAVVVAPVYSKASHAVSEARATTPSSGGGKHTTPGAPSVTQPQLQQLARQIGFHTRGDSIFVYALISPLTRSSAPALWYPVIFPHKHSYYHLDAGQDILGYGAMPDDNIVVWNYLNPNLPGGTEMVPYQFVLYSQGGTALAIGLSLVLGALLAAVWRATQSARVPRPWDALLGALTVLLAVYLGIDSLRNSVLVSYGVIWGFVFVGVAMLLTLIVRRAGAATPSLLPRRTGRPEAG